MDQKGQIALELILTILIIFLILIVMTLYSIEKVQESNNIKSLIDAKRICTSIAYNLDAIKGQGQGYYKYFSIPERIHGNYDYDVIINESVVTVLWDENKWFSTRRIASNVTIHCMDYGENETNRIWNRGSHLEITCYRPNLKPREDSIRYWNDNGNVTVSVKFENDAHIYATAFNVSIDSNREDVAGLDSYERIEVNYTIVNMPAGGYSVVITTDTDDTIDESIEADNVLNKTITI